VCVCEREREREERERERGERERERREREREERERERRERGEMREREREMREREMRERDEREPVRNARANSRILPPELLLNLRINVTALRINVTATIFQTDCARMGFIPTSFGRHRLLLLLLAGT
jgi:hypothetical protein